MNRLESSSPRPSPPQVCGGEGEEARGSSWPVNSSEWNAALPKNRTVAWPLLDKRRILPGAFCRPERPGAGGGKARPLIFGFQKEAGIAFAILNNCLYINGWLAALEKTAKRNHINPLRAFLSAVANERSVKL
jgi:hypothetical protein